MHSRTFSLLSLLVIAAMLLGACAQPAATTAPTAAKPAATTAPAVTKAAPAATAPVATTAPAATKAAATTAPVATVAPAATKAAATVTAAAAKKLKVGLVTDVGKIDDKSLQPVRLGRRPAGPEGPGRRDQVHRDHRPEGLRQEHRPVRRRELRRDRDRWLRPRRGHLRRGQEVPRRSSSSAWTSSRPRTTSTRTSR